MTGLFVSLAFFFFNCRLRSNRLIKMSSPILNLFIATGGMLLSICSALYGLDYFLRDFSAASSAVCKARVGLLASGFSLLFGPMFGKSWRVFRLFQNAGKKRMMEPAHAGGSNSSTPLQIIQVHCCTRPASPFWLAAFLILKMALLCYGLFLSWQTRAVALPSMNDSRCIVVSALTTVAMATLAVSVTHVLPERPNVVCACVVLSVWLCTMVTLCTAFIPKVSLWWRNPEAKGLRVSVNSSSSGSHLFPFQQLEEEMAQVTVENEALRKSMEAKDDSIRQLQQHLTNAYKRLSHLGLNLGDLIQDSGLDADFSSSSSSSSSDTENRADCPRLVPTSRSTSRNLGGSDSKMTSFRGGNPGRNGDFRKESIQWRDSAMKQGKGGNFVSFENGGFQESGDFDCSLRDRKSSDLYSAMSNCEEEKRFQSSSVKNSPSSNTEGDSPFSGPSVSGRKTSQEMTRSPAVTSNSGGSLVPRLRLGKSPRQRYCGQDGFVSSPVSHPEYDQTCSVFKRTNSTSENTAQATTSRRDSAYSDTAKASSSHNSDRSNKRRRRRRHHHHHHHHHPHRQHRRRHSAASVTSVERVSELRAAIALDLQRARSLSNVLGNSVSKDLDNMYRRHSCRVRRRSSSIKSREDLAESIVGSYGLEDSTDAVSYISSFLPVPSLPDWHGDFPTSRTERSVLDNDVLYPERRHKHVATSPRERDQGWGSYACKDGNDSRAGGRSEPCERAPETQTSYRRHFSLTDERDAKSLAGKLKKKQRLCSVPNSNVSGCEYWTACRDTAEQNGRGVRGVQGGGDNVQEVFSVHTPHPPSFVQKGYALTRTLYSTDTYI